MVRMKITIIVFYYISQLHNVYAVLKVHQKYFEFLEKDLIFGHESFKDGKLTYAVCTKTDLSSEKVCNVTREKEPMSNDTFTCNVTLKILVTKDNGGEADEQFGIVPFGKDKAVLYFIQRYKRTTTRLNTIQFNGCQVVETNITVSKFVFSKYNIVIIPYRNSYDVVYPTMSKGFQKVTINPNGERIHGPVGLGYYLWLANFPYILPISQRSRNKGFVYLSFVRDTLDEYSLNLWRPSGKSGSTKSLGKYEIHFRSIKSIGHDLIGICHDVKNSGNCVKCMQYSVDGKLKFEKLIIGRENQSIAFIHNVPGGGFFLFGGQWDNESKDVDFFLIKLDSAGKKNGSLSIGEIKLRAEALATTFYQNEDNEFCMSIVDYNAIGMNSIFSVKPYYIDQYVNCFHDSDFL